MRERFNWQKRPEVLQLGLLVARIRGDFTADAILQALAETRQIHPLLCARPQEDADGTAWLVEGDGETPRLIDGVSAQQWLEVLRAEAVVPLSWRGLIRIVVLRGEGFLDLLVVGHHVFFDALSLRQVISTFLDRLTDPEAVVERCVTPPAVTEILPDWAFDALEVDHPLPMPTQASGRPVSPEVTGELRFSVACGSLTRAETSALVDACNRERTSVYGALAAAFLLELPSPGDRTRLILTPVSVRRWLRQPLRHKLGLYIALAKLRIHGDPGSAFWDVARDASRELGQVATPQRMLAAWAAIARANDDRGYEEAMRWLGPLLAADYDLSISHHGVWSSFDTRLIPEHVYGVAANRIHQRTLNTIIVDGRLDVTVAAPDAAMDEATATRLLEAGMARLIQAPASARADA